LLADLTPTQAAALATQAVGQQILTGSCSSTPGLKSGSVALIVTSPPFLDTVDYAHDNWLRGWFCGVDTSALPIWCFRKQTDWVAAMERSFAEFTRVLHPGGHLASKWAKFATVRSSSRNRC
jgi:DNA modification methylase